MIFLNFLFLNAEEGKGLYLNKYIYIYLYIKTDLQVDCGNP